MLPWISAVAMDTSMNLVALHSLCFLPCSTHAQRDATRTVFFQVFKTIYYLILRPLSALPLFGTPPSSPPAVCVAMVTVLLDSDVCMCRVIGACTVAVRFAAR